VSSVPRPDENLADLARVISFDRHEKRPDEMVRLLY